MLLNRQRVGGHPGAPGSEEAHRPPARPAAADLTTRQRSLRYLQFALGRRRTSMHAAALIALAITALLSFAIFPPRSVRILADGTSTTVAGRYESNVTLAERAGVELRDGDRVESIGENVVAVRRATDVQLTVDGVTLRIRTQAATIEELLLDSGITLSAEDSVLRDGAAVPAYAPLSTEMRRSIATTSPVTLAVRRALPFTVESEGRRIVLRSSRATLAEALRDAGVRPGPGDRVLPPLDSAITAGMAVQIDRATAIFVTRPEGIVSVYSLSATVADALTEGSVTLPAHYRLEPGAETALTPGLNVHVVSVLEEQQLEQERIISRTVYREDAGLAWGESRVASGRDGVRYRQYEIVYENGEFVSRELAGEWFDPAPVDRVIYYSGAQPPPAPNGFADGIQVSQVRRVYATWYSPASAGRPPSDPNYGITATGVPVTRGIVAVDPNVIPLGTRLYIPGYGYAIAADTGGGIHGEVIDLGYPDNVAVDWTTRWVDIYILAS